MPKNRFPDSPEKREIRRIDARLIERFKSKPNVVSGLSYCGMPSVEFLDVIAWSNSLSHVEAIEYDAEVHEDMMLQWKSLALPLTFKSHVQNVYEYLSKTSDTFDVYNLDFYGGFLNPKKKGGANATDSLRALIARHGQKQHSFVLVATFNIRESGMKDYDKFIDEIPDALVGCSNVKQNCDDHKKKAFYKTKIGYPYFCWDVGRTHGFSVRFTDIYYYQSSVPLLHFYSEFIHAPAALHSVASMQSVVELANKPLKQLHGLVPEVVFQPTPIALPA